MFRAIHGSDSVIQDKQSVQRNHFLEKHICYEAQDGFTHLQAHVSTTAFDSAQQVDTPKCHPNTRQAVLDEIINWVLQSVMRVQWIMWLNGAAGAGKSAIARSIVSLCLARNIIIARFFFFRTDATRNTLQSVVATLVHQLIQQIPDLLAIVVPRIDSDPLIFMKSFETQLRYLVFEPLQQLHREGALTSILVLLFDGVDECDGDNNQTALVRSLADFLKHRDLPIIVFFGSRAEYQLQQIFRCHDVSINLRQLALDDHYLPDEDIHLFLNDKFLEIKNSHPLSHFLDKDWPSNTDAQEIVEKSSGQFIYSSVVINFVSSPRHHPARQLEIVRGLRPAGKLTPFAQLDVLYRHILSQIQDADRTFLILAWDIFNPDHSIENGFSSCDIVVLLADLASVLCYSKEDGFRFLHASLPDFLLDQTRSQEYYLDKKIWCTRLSIYCFCATSVGMFRPFGSLANQFLQHAEGTAELREHILLLDLNLPHRMYNDLAPYLTAIQTVDFGDNGELYQSQLNRVIRHILRSSHKFYRDVFDTLEQHHDIWTILDQIESESAAAIELWRIGEIEFKSTTCANTEHREVPRELETTADIEKVRHAAVSDWEKTWTTTPDFDSSHAFYDCPLHRMTEFMSFMRHMTTIPPSPAYMVDMFMRCEEIARHAKAETNERELTALNILHWYRHGVESGKLEPWTLWRPVEVDTRAVRGANRAADRHIELEATPGAVSEQDAGFVFRPDSRRQNMSDQRKDVV